MPNVRRRDRPAVKKGRPYLEISPDLKRTYGSTLRSCEAVGGAAPVGASQLEQRTEIPGPIAGDCAPPHVPRETPASPAPTFLTPSELPPLLKTIARGSSAPFLNDSKPSVSASVRGARGFTTDKFCEITEGCVSDESGCATRVSGSTEGKYHPMGDTPSVTEGHTGGNFYILDMAASIGGKSDTQAFGEAPTPITPRSIRVVDAGRDSEAVNPRLLPIGENASRSHEESAKVETSTSEGPSDR